MKLSNIHEDVHKDRTLASPIAGPKNDRAQTPTRDIQDDPTLPPRATDQRKLHSGLVALQRVQNVFMQIDPNFELRFGMYFDGSPSYAAPEQADGKADLDNLAFLQSAIRKINPQLSKTLDVSVKKLNAFSEALRAIIRKASGNRILQDTDLYEAANHELSSRLDRTTITKLRRGVVAMTIAMRGLLKAWPTDAVRQLGALWGDFQSTFGEAIDTVTSFIKQRHKAHAGDRWDKHPKDYKAAREIRMPEDDEIDFDAKPPKKAEHTYFQADWEKPHSGEDTSW